MEIFIAIAVVALIIGLLFSSWLSRGRQIGVQIKEIVELKKVPGRAIEALAAQVDALRKVGADNEAEINRLKERSHNLEMMNAILEQKEFPQVKIALAIYQRTASEMIKDTGIAHKWQITFDQVSQEIQDEVTGERRPTKWDVVTAVVAALTPWSSKKDKAPAQLQMPRPQGQRKETSPADIIDAD